MVNGDVMGTSFGAITLPNAAGNEACRRGC